MRQRELQLKYCHTLTGVINDPSKFCSARKFRLLLEMLANIFGCSFARACTVLQVLACSVLVRVVF